MLREAGLSLLPILGTQWTVEDGKFSRDPHEAELHKVLRELKDDLTVAEFQRRRFAGPEYGRLRHSTERMVEGYERAAAAAQVGFTATGAATRRADHGRVDAAARSPDD